MNEQHGIFFNSYLVVGIIEICQNSPRHLQYLCRGQGVGVTFSLRNRHCKISKTKESLKYNKCRTGSARIFSKHRNESNRAAYDVPCSGQSDQLTRGPFANARIQRGRYPSRSHRWADRKSKNSQELYKKYFEL